VEGILRTDMHPTIRGYFPASDTYFEYFKENNAESCLKALNDLEKFVDMEGPFDGVIAFSQGASVAATLMLRKMQQNPARESIDPVFKCAIFLGAALPCDPAALEEGCIRAMLYESDGAPIRVPTTHIWGEHDPSPYPSQLAKLCVEEQRNVYVHGAGHEVPGSQSEEATLRDCVRFIRRSISKAQSHQ
jgi:hypothetical protein